jgi:hypothetical protein
MMPASDHSRDNLLTALFKSDHVFGTIQWYLQSKGNIGARRGY